jgi:hypothetical protein
VRLVAGEGDDTAVAVDRLLVVTFGLVEPPEGSRNIAYTQGGGRAGERKTDWTKPAPPSPGLWALKRATVPGIALSAHHDAGSGAVVCAIRAGK